MEKVNIIIEVKHFVECPHCHNSKNRIDHLFNDEGKETSWGHWYCDECGGGYKGIVKGKDVFVEKVNERKDNSIVFLKNGNTDPHGIFEFVGSIPYVNLDEVEDVKALLPSFDAES